MKRKLLLAFLSIIPSIVFAYDAVKDGFYYNILSENTAEVVNCDHTGDVTLPDAATLTVKTTDGEELELDCSIVAVAENGFVGSGITSVTIPSSIKSIGKNAFSECGGLQTVNLSGGTKIISDGAFDNCAALSDIQFTGGVEEIDGFDRCTALTSIEFKEGTKTISGFNECSGLQSVSFPKSVRTITGFEKSSIKTVNISDIAAWCSVDKSDSTFGRSNWQSPTYDLYLNGAKVKNLKIPNGVSEIATNAFEFTSIESVSIPSSVKVINREAFSSCHNLTEITLNEGLQQIGPFAFCASRITNITIPSSVKKIEMHAFNKCNLLTEVNVPDLNAWCNIEKTGSIFTLVASTYEYPEGAHFAVNGKRVDDLVIPDAISTIKDNCFDGLIFKSITIPESVTSIGSRAFGIQYIHPAIDPILINFNAVECADNDGYALSVLPYDSYKLNIGNDVTRLPLNVFAIKEYSGKWIGGPSEVNYNAIECEDVGKSGNYFFEHFNNMSSLNIGRDVMIIPDYTFYGCSALKRLTVERPEDIEEIGSHAFWGCDGLLAIDNENTRVSTNFARIALANATEYPSYSYTMPYNGTPTYVYDGEHHINTGVDGNEFVYGLKLGNNNCDINKASLYATFTGDVEVTSPNRARIRFTVSSVFIGEVGVEYRRADAPESEESIVKTIPVFNGLLLLEIDGLEANTTYKLRTFYTMLNGTKVYGTWQTFTTGEIASNITPETKSMSVKIDNNQTVTIEGYVLAGTEDVVERGFELWTIDEPQSRSYSDRITIPVDGVAMSITLDDIEDGATYSYRVYAKTATRTYYGDQITFVAPERDAVQGIAADPSSIDISYDGNVLKITGADTATHIAIYNIAGQCIYSGTAKEIALNGRGIYILQAVSGDTVQTKRFIVR